MVHARISAKKFGGKAEDYLAIHDFMDCTKMALPDVRHRMMLHNAVGCFIAERVFGHTIVNSENKTVHVRDVAEAHVIEDLGFIPTLEKCFSGMPIETWMGGKVSAYKEESKPQPVLLQEDNTTAAPTSVLEPVTTGTPLPSLPTSISGADIFIDGVGARRNSVFVD